MQPMNIIDGSWKQGVAPRVVNLNGTAFMEEAGAHMFRIHAQDENGAAVAFTGTVTALFLRADNTTVALDGSLSDGVAEVTLVSDCYNVPGRFSIAVYVSDGTDSTCVYAAVGNVFRTSSGTVIDSGAEIPSLAQLEAAYDACIAATAAASNAVSYEAQTGKTDAQKGNARTNIGAVGQDELASLTSVTTGAGADLVTGYTNANWLNTDGTVKPSTDSNYFRAVDPITVAPGDVYYVDVNARNTKETVIFAASTAVENEYTYISGQTYAAGVSGTKTGRFTAMLTVPAGADTLLINQYGSPASYTAYCHKVEQKTDSTLTQSNVAAEAAAVGARISALDTRMTAAESTEAALADGVAGNAADLDMVTAILDPVGTVVNIGTKSTGYWKYNGDGETAVIVESSTGSWRYWPAVSVTPGKRMLVQGLRHGNSANTKPIMITDASYKVLMEIENKSSTVKKDYRFTIPDGAVYMLLTTYTNTEPVVYEIDGYAPIIEYPDGKPTVTVGGTAKQLVTMEKLPYASGNIFFTVDCPRPIPFSDETYQQTDEAVECVLRLPSAYTPDGTPTRLVLACHGSTGYIEAATGTWYNSNWNGFMNSLVSAGYAVFDANIFAKNATLHPDWNYDDPSSGNYYTKHIGYALGSPLYAQALKRAYDYIVEHYNVYPQIFAHGTSMGGVGAKTFAHLYPQLVLAVSSFAGRDVCKYVRQLNEDDDNDNTDVAGEMAEPFGYASGSALTADCFGHAIGISSSLGLMKIENGAIVPPPDRTANYAGWMAYYAAINSQTAATAATVQYIGRTATPYKAWNAWNDNAGDTAQEVIMQKAYARGGGAPYEIVNYNLELQEGQVAHTLMSYGQVNNMRSQLVAWYKRWE